jgi:hypothetical protein
MSTVHRSRFVIPVLGLLNVVLLLTAVVLGIYCEYNPKVDTTTNVWDCIVYCHGKKMLIVYIGQLT